MKVSSSRVLAKNLEVVAFENLNFNIIDKSKFYYLIDL